MERNFIAFRLRPYLYNFNKRIVKMSKLNFYNTELALDLIGVEIVGQLALHPFRGRLFENMVIVDFLEKDNIQERLTTYFWV